MKGFSVEDLAACELRTVRGFESADAYSILRSRTGDKPYKRLPVGHNSVYLPLLDLTVHVFVPPQKPVW